VRSNLLALVGTLFQASATSACTVARSHLHQGRSCSHWWRCVWSHTRGHTQDHTPCSRM